MIRMNCIKSWSVKGSGPQTFIRMNLKRQMVCDPRPYHGKPVASEIRRKLINNNAFS